MFYLCQQITNKLGNISYKHSFTAANTGAYIPINNKIKLPEMPGKIIAQIAIAPANNVLMAVGSMCSLVKQK